MRRLSAVFIFPNREFETGNLFNEVVLPELSKSPTDMFPSRMIGRFVNMTDVFPVKCLMCTDHDDDIFYSERTNPMPPLPPPSRSDNSVGPLHAFPSLVVRKLRSGVPIRKGPRSFCEFVTFEGEIIHNWFTFLILS